MAKLSLLMSVLLFLLLHSFLAQAKEFPVQARFFFGATSVDPEDLNQEMNSQLLDKVENVATLGIEATYPVARFLDFGVRYSHKFFEEDERSNSVVTDYKATLAQDTVLVLARIPIIKSNFVRLDGFGGVGGTNTTLKIRTASQNGELTKTEAGDWFASLYTAYGASVALGYKHFFLVVEAGVESNVVNEFDRVGTVNTNVAELDLSGSYVTVGLMFDGLSGSKK